MTKKNALIEVKQKKITKIFNFLKNIFNKKTQKRTEYQEMDCLEILKKVVSGEQSIDELDDELKIKLIDMCNQRQNDIDKKVNMLKNKNEQINKIIQEIEEL